MPQATPTIVVTDYEPGSESNDPYRFTAVVKGDKSRKRGGTGPTEAEALKYLMLDFPPSKRTELAGADIERVAYCPPPPLPVALPVAQKKPPRSMIPMPQEQYRAVVRDMAEVAGQWRRADPAMSRERLVDEIHEAINAPDSFFHWHDGRTEDVALDVLRWSDHRTAGLDCDRYVDGIVTAGEVNWEFLAAWAFVADVLACMGED